MGTNNHVRIENSSIVEYSKHVIEEHQEIKTDFLIDRYNITERDLMLIQTVLKPVLEKRIPDMVCEFYDWVKILPEYTVFFKSEEMLNHVQKAQERYWIEMLEGRLDETFIGNRVKLARTHSRINLSLDTYFAAHAYFSNWIMKEVSSEPTEQKLEALTSFMKIQQIDLAIVVNEYNERKVKLIKELIQRQAETITKLATPIAVLAEDILLVSVIGIIDSKRAQDILETTLSKVLETTSKVTIIDIAGVDVVDTAVANHLIKMTKAIKLMGCNCILSGVSPAIALTVVQLGIDLKELTTKAVLRDAVEEAYTIVQKLK